VYRWGLSGGFAVGFRKEIMKTFKTFLSACGVDDSDEFILFLNNLPDNPDELIKIQGIERFKEQIDMVFDAYIRELGGYQQTSTS